MKKVSIRPCLALVLILSIIIMLLSLSQGVEATIFKVNSTDDIVDAAPGDGACATGTGVCTLRAAVQEANAFSGADTIVLKAKKYYLSIPGTAEDVSATGDLDITDSLTIKGVSSIQTIINGGALDRVFQIIGPITVKFVNFSIQNGFAQESGAGIYNLGGNVFLASCSCANNVSSGNLALAGGGILSTGVGSSLNIKSSSVINNKVVSTGISSALGGGIAVYDGALNISASKIAYNSTISSGSAFGGGIMSVVSAGITIINSKVSGNSASSFGGMAAGGGIALSSDSAAAVIRETSIIMNSIVASGGEALGGGVYVANETVSIISCMIKSNTASGILAPGGHGGGIVGDSSSITVKKSSSILSNMASLDGGGIKNWGGSTISVSPDSTVANNMPNDQS